jgi:pilus assembly protein TadC
MLTLGVIAVFMVVSLFHMRERRQVRRDLDRMLDRIE